MIVYGKNIEKNILEYINKLLLSDISNEEKEILTKTRAELEKANTFLE